MGSALKSIASLAAGLLLVFALFLIVASMRDGLPEMASDTADEVVPRGVFIHVSSGSDNPQRALMALQMGQLMRENRERPVLMYFDIKGIELMVADGPEFSMKPFLSVSEYRESLIKSGVQLQVCPSCLEAAGYSEEDLIPGAELADKADFFEFSEGDVLSLTY
ncbi:MAG: DsrE family protein [Opitutales bacterium]